METVDQDNFRKSICIGLNLSHDGPSSITFARNMKNFFGNIGICKSLLRRANLRHIWAASKLLFPSSSAVTLYTKLVVPRDVKLMSGKHSRNWTRACGNTGTGKHPSVDIFNNVVPTLILRMYACTRQRYPQLLLALEAVCIHRKKPALNSRDDFGSHTLNCVF